MKTLAAFLLFATAAFAQPSITPTVPMVRPGDQVTITIVLSDASGPALQFFLPQIPGVIYTATPGAALTLTAGKTLNCAASPAPSPALYGCIVSGGISPLVDGVIATITFPSPAVGTYALPISQLIGASVAGDPVIISAGTPMSLIVMPLPCDINADGKVDSADVALSIQNAIARLISAALDLSGDGSVNVVDVQRVIVAAGGGACKAGA